MRSLPESSPPSGAAGPVRPVRPVGSAGPTTPDRRSSGRSSPRPSRRLSPAARKWLVVVHLVASVGWLALMLCLLTLAAAALATDDADRVRAAYRAMGMLGDVLVLPLSLLTFASGVVLGLGTTWGLFRHYWVTTKFWLTLAAMGASVFALPDRLHDAVRAVAAHPVGPIAGPDLGFVRYNVVIVPSVALGLYLFLVVVSVHKPWGRRTPRIPRARGASRAA